MARNLKITLGSLVAKYHSNQSLSVLELGEKWKNNFMKNLQLLKLFLILKVK